MYVYAMYVICICMLSAYAVRTYLTSDSGLTYLISLKSNRLHRRLLNHA